MVVKCLKGCKIGINSVNDYTEDEFIGGRLYVLEDDKDLIGEYGNRIPIIGFWRNFEVQKPHKRKSKFKD